MTMPSGQTSKKPFGDICIQNYDQVTGLLVPNYFSNVHVNPFVIGRRHHSLEFMPLIFRFSDNKQVKWQLTALVCENGSVDRGADHLAFLSKVSDQAVLAIKFTYQLLN